MREKRRLRFPLFLSLEGREILIIGAGRIAARRARVLLPFWGQDPDMCAAEGGGTSERDAALDPGEADPVREQEVFSGAYLWKGVSCFCRHQ